VAEIEVDPQLIEALAEVGDDPLAFVMWAFPWGEPGTRLAEEVGPEEWQASLLSRIRDGLISPNQAILEATASGHGVGKSCCVAWIILWAMSTMSDTKGVITANTETQLKTKTWAELGKWYHMFIAKDLFKLTATSLFHPERERTWRIDMVPWSERNTEAFAGLHNKGKRILLIFDEASAIPDVIWETSEGALTDADTQILWLVFGNPTRNTGRFKDCFPGGAFSNLWHCTQVDSRTVRFTNKEQIAKWMFSYGEDSDFIRIRVLGSFPRVGEMEFFNAEDVAFAAAREAVSGFSDPLALGVDVARYGKNSSVIYPRKGRDARTYERERYQGLSTVQLSDKVFEANFRLHADGIMVDGGGVGGGVVDQLRAKALHIFEVQFGSKDDTPHMTWGSQGERCANKRTGMYAALRAWLKTGCIPSEPALLKQFSSIRYIINKRDELQLISKEDMLKLDPDLELDDIDALALTFAHALAAHDLAGGEHIRRPLVEHEYDPLAAFAKELAA
jgi:hypothetical protein